MTATRTVSRSNRWRVLLRRNQWLVLGLLAVSLLLWGRLRMREIPRVAVADDPPRAAAISAPPRNPPPPVPQRDEPSDSEQPFGL